MLRAFLQNLTVEEIFHSQSAYLVLAHTTQESINKNC